MCTQKIKSIGILGAGAFGTALAILYARKFNVSMFSCFHEHVEEMKKSRVNEYFPDFKIPTDIAIDTTDNLHLHDTDCIFWVFPIKPTEEILKELKQYINGVDVIICSKGLLSNGETITDLFKRTVPDSKIGYLSGPNFAIELANKKLSAADIVFEEITEAKTFADELSLETFKLLPRNDMIGAQICGAVKNISAIACGIAYGLNLGQNTHAALLSFAISEMKELGMCLGGKPDTFYGLCGLGDLILTASSETSRNTTLGKKLASGITIDEIMRTNKSVCEGYDTITQIVKLAEKNNIRMPICSTVYKVLFEGADPKSILDVFN